jgi:hypothetical protein
VDTSTYIALADAMADWQHGSAQFLSGKDLTGYDFLSRSVPMSTQTNVEWLWYHMEQYRSITNDMCETLEVLMR